ncbi:MAG: glucans biosynthesis glucosyltransferase MdoH [Acidiferrobacteraceae bacterium]
MSVPEQDILPWTYAARRRRALFFLLVSIPALIAAHFFSEAMAGNSAMSVPGFLTAMTFCVLYAWTAAGFWVASAGFVRLISRPDQFTISQPAPESGPLPPTAVIMPICNESVDRVYAGLRASMRSLQDTGLAHHFDFFVLSDSNEPRLWVREEWAWTRLRSEFGRAPRVYYRRRKLNLNAKSGNINDFCRRWGSRYRYAIILDADSVMSGSTMVHLTRLIQANPSLGIIQTSPRLVNRHSMFARMQQFAARLYGTLFAAGLRFWQLGDGHYIGHNAIVRLAPFMEHCALPRLSGKAPLGGHIMSHDFVEAALMRRAGYGVWLEYELEGSYEENPASLLDDLARDRRWCQGNLQHLRLLTVRGLNAAHRLLFVNGALSYLSSPLWFGFILLTGAESFRLGHTQTLYFSSNGFFPIWPISHEFLFLRLLASTMALLLVPRIMALALALARRPLRKGFGGARLLLSNAALELVVSSLLAPVRMWFHTRFVLLTLLGRPVQWRSPKRKDAPTRWKEALERHGIGSLVSLAGAIFVYFTIAPLFWWMLPVFAGLILSIPLSVLSSSPQLGKAARRAGLFLIPEERDPPAVLQDLARAQDEADREPAFAAGVAEAVTNPRMNALLANRSGSRKCRASTIRSTEIYYKALHLGPDALSTEEQRTLLTDPALLRALHRAIWRLPDAAFCRWGSRLA